MKNLFNIIYEDADLLVVHKPADLVCHPTKGDEYSSLISQARIYLRSQSSPEAVPYLIHRLDRETSGLVVIAKHPSSARALGKIWETRSVQKEYLAIVHGHVPIGQGTIDAPLGKDLASRIAIKDCVRPDGASAQTGFFVEKRFERDIIVFNDKITCMEKRPFSLLRITPQSGRKHQIRIHLAYIGHPIVGDKIYGGDEDAYLALVEGRMTPGQRERLLLPNQALHASRIAFNWHGMICDFSSSPEPLFAAFTNPD